MANDTPESPAPADAPATPPPQLPACPEAENGARRPGWFNPLAVAAILLVIILAALIIHNEKRHRSALDLLPPETNFYHSYPHAAAVHEIAANLPLWSKGTDPDAKRKAEITKLFGKLPDDAAKAFSQNVTHWGTADVAGVPCLILECGSAWDVKKAFADARGIDFSGFKDAYQIALPSGKPMFFALLKPYAVFTPNKATLGRIVACWQGARSIGSSLERAPFTFPPAHRSEIFSRREGPISFAGIDGVAAPGTCLFLEATFKDRQLHAHADNAVIPVKEAAPEADAGGHGFWHYALWTLLVLVLIVVGLPLLFILVVLLLAGYYHVMSKIRHEDAIPTVAPALPPLSNEMAEDLKGGKPAPEAPQAPEAPATDAAPASAGAPENPAAPEKPAGDSSVSSPSSESGASTDSNAPASPDAHASGA
ncbi:MAG: hypothetical protein J6333_07085 [Planctomycetes bacterium]|nr:hypothetical protein [Planctomycetota bacterium]